MACAFIPACHLLARKARMASLAQPAKANIAKFATIIPKHETNIAKFGTFVSNFAISHSRRLVGRGTIPLKKRYEGAKGKARGLKGKLHTTTKDELPGHERKKNKATKGETHGLKGKGTRPRGKSHQAMRQKHHGCSERAFLPQKSHPRSPVRRAAGMSHGCGQP